MGGKFFFKKVCKRKRFPLIFAVPKNEVVVQVKGFGSVVQLVRMPPCHGGGRGFESRPVRKTRKQKPCKSLTYEAFLF